MFGVSGQVYYRHKKRSSNRRSIADKVVELVIGIRNKMPCIGTRKLYFMLRASLKAWAVGRDRLFRILKANHLLIIPKRSYCITTNSHHHFRKHKDLIEDLTMERPEQVWVADITYLGGREKPCYLSLVTDAYSKMIVGYEVSSNMNAENNVKALEMAIKNRKYRKEKLIHHSDRGIQYCCEDYQKTLTRSNIQCSMTESYDPYRNAVAERVNGILKQEFLLEDINKDLSTMKKVVAESICIYNNQRPHYSCYMKTPFQMHQQ
ncbi:MAG: transposase, partial [Mucilaginibacter sp.]|nr:transposase [Mucilaginibacter sp.]